MKIGSYSVELTNQDKVWFIRPKITKGEIVEYYAKIAPRMLPFMKNRPVAMHRFPDGIMGEGFYHKDAPDFFPKWIKRFKIKKKEDGSVNYVVINNAATLVYLANFGCLTPHPFLSMIKKINYPDQIIFDLDPPGYQFEVVRKTAFVLHDLIIELGLKPFVKTTGSRGLHVVIPIKPLHTFDVVRKFASDIAEHLIIHNPKQLTLEVRKDKRNGRLFMDVMRNALGQTAVAPYAVRAYPKAPVATPIFWDELKNKKLRSNTYTIENIFQRLKKKSDPWKEFKRSARSISAAQKRIEKLLKGDE